MGRLEAFIRIVFNDYCDGYDLQGIACCQVDLRSAA
jgi:hypothetical protein